MITVLGSILADSRLLAIYSDDIISDTKNRKQGFTIEELCYIGLMNTEGSKIYMDGLSGAVRETVFQTLTGREMGKSSGWNREWLFYGKGTV